MFNAINSSSPGKEVEELVAVRVRNHTDLLGYAPALRDATRDMILGEDEAKKLDAIASGSGAAHCCCGK